MLCGFVAAVLPPDNHVHKKSTWPFPGGRHILRRTTGRAEDRRLPRDGRGRANERRTTATGRETEQTDGHRTNGATTRPLDTTRRTDRRRTTSTARTEDGREENGRRPDIRRSGRTGGQRTTTATMGRLRRDGYDGTATTGRRRRDGRTDDICEYTCTVAVFFT